MIIGAQLYTLRDFCRNLSDFSETLKKVADIGYTTVQVSGTCAYEAEWLRDELKKHHIDRVSRQECTLETGFVFNDLLTNYERVSDHCSNIAVAMIELDADVFDTHEYLSQVKEKRSADFERVYEDYRERFAI